MTTHHEIAATVAAELRQVANSLLLQIEEGHPPDGSQVQALARCAKALEDAAGEAKGRLDEIRAEIRAAVVGERL